jgi:transposase-like protein
MTQPFLTEVKRWTARRKAALVEAVREGRVSRHLALKAHDLSEEELAAWERAWLAHGVAGLASTKNRGAKE